MNIIIFFAVADHSEVEMFSKTFFSNVLILKEKRLLKVVYNLKYHCSNSDVEPRCFGLVKLLHVDVGDDVTV